MTIKTMDGQSQNVASSATGNAGLTLGIIGTGLALLNGGTGLGGILGNNKQQYVTKEELDMSMKISEQNATIALLQSEKTTDAKLVDGSKTTSTTCGTLTSSATTATTYSPPITSPMKQKRISSTWRTPSIPLTLLLTDTGHLLGQFCQHSHHAISR